jgi:dTDP-4-amino-4,6-dideoxygalactose transaminase
MKVPLLDLKAQYLALKPGLDAAVAEVMESQNFILGPRVQDCENSIAQYCGCSFGIGVSSGTDALLVSLMAEDIGPGDEVITTPYTFFATVGAIARLGATPVFVDIDPVSYNIDPDLIAARITSRTRAIIPVHLYGQMADMDQILAIALRNNLIVIEDAAQAIGAEHQGYRAGSRGDYGCLSFFPSKNLGASGDAGMVLTNDPVRAEKIRRLRSHGSQPKYYHALLGGNFRLDALQAAVISVKLKYLDAWTAGRQRNAQRYSALLAASGLRVAESAAHWLQPAQPSSTQRDGEAPEIITPSVVTARHVYNQFVVRVSSRTRVKELLEARGVAVEIYYPVPMHLQECFSELGYLAGSFPQSEAAANETLALPIYPELTDEQARYVVDSLRDCIRAANGSSLA